MAHWQIAYNIKSIIKENFFKKFPQNSMRILDFDII